VIFRRSMPELEELIARSQELYRPLGAEWFSGRKTWNFPCGSNLKMRWLDRDQDADHYQGHQYCVGVGTPVLMADDTWKPIERIRIGEYVATLAGPRRVTLTVAPYKAPCVTATLRVERRLVAEQVHPVWHPLLTIAGLTYERRSRLHRTFCRSPRETLAPYKRGEGLPLYEGQENSAWFAYSINNQSGHVVSCGGRRGSRPSQASFCHVALHARGLHLTETRVQGHREPTTECCSPYRQSVGFRCLCQEMRLAQTDLWPLCGRVGSVQDHDGARFSNDQSYELCETRKAQGFRATDCPIDNGCGDELFLELSGIGQGRPQRSGGVEGSSHGPIMLERGQGTTPIRNRLYQRSWMHPYTGEARNLLEEVAVGEVEFRPIGMAWVADISVEDANHYITSGGMVNKNSYLGADEIGTWPSPSPLDKLRATLRTVHRIPCILRTTANPGGIGQHWINERYIRPSPPGVPFFDEERRVWRVFIPSRLRDNRKLMEADPGYEDRLRSSGPPWLVRAWLDGDWTASAGQSYFVEDAFLVDGQPVEYPRFCDSVLAVIDTAVKTGSGHDGTAVSYWCTSARTGIPLMLLDWDIIQIEGALLEIWIKGVFDRLEELARETHARYGSIGAYIEDAQSGAVLLQQCALRGYPAVALPSELTSMGKDGRALNAGPEVYRGNVKFSRHAYEKTVQFKGETRNHMLSQVTGYRLGDKDAAKRSDDLIDTLTYTVAISLGNSEGIA
jgi:hypothetical protein